MTKYAHYTHESAPDAWEYQQNLAADINFYPNVKYRVEDGTELNTHYQACGILEHSGKHICFILLNNCAHLDGGSWIITDE